MTRGTDDPLPWSWARERLVAERNYWVSTVTSIGRPHARPVWGVFLDDALYLSIGAAGFRREDRQRHVSVHVDSATDVVIVDGMATRVDAATAGDEASATYEEKYGMSGDFLNFVVSPRVAWGWRDGDVNTATKWTFTP